MSTPMRGTEVKDIRSIHANLLKIVVEIAFGQPNFDHIIHPGVRRRHLIGQVFCIAWEFSTLSSLQSKPPAGGHRYWPSYWKRRSDQR